MAIPSSGPLSFTTIQTEFGGANPIGLNEYYAGGAYVPAGTTGTNGAVPSSGALSINKFYGTTAVVRGCATYTTAGVYTWVAPAGVTKVSVLVIAGGGLGGNSGFCGCEGWGGGGGGGGGGLQYRNNYTVTPGSSYTVTLYGGSSTYNSFIGTCVVGAQGGQNGLGGGVGGAGGVRGSYTACGGVVPGGQSGGNGGRGLIAGGSTTFAVGGGGGGGPGYTGFGGNGSNGNSGSNGSAGAGGGGGGGAGPNGSCNESCNRRNGGGGGGTGAYGAGSSGAGGVVSFTQSVRHGGNGSGSTSSLDTANGGAFGGGGGGGGTFGSPRGSLGGAVIRIVWPGNTRQFPSTDVGA